MRIALMTNNYKPFIGGVSISVERLARGLEQLGHQVTVFAPTYGEMTEEKNVIRYATLMKRFIGGIVLPNPFDRRIEKAFRENQYDVIHVHHPMLIGRTAVYLSKKYGIPLTFTYHTRYEQYLSYVGIIRKLEECAKAKEGFFHKQAEKILYGIQKKMVPAYLHSFFKHCDFVFAPTKGMQEYLITECNVPLEKTAVLPTGIEEHHFRMSAEEKEILRKEYHAENIPLFLSVSRMSHEKNVEFLLRSIQKVKERYGKAFRVVLVGDGPNKKEYEALCKVLQIEGEVIFAGTVPNEQIAPYYAAADAFLFASKTETQGIVIVEALAGGTPVFALKATGVSDLVENGVNGFLSSEDEDEYSERIMEYLNGKINVEILTEAAYQSAFEYREEAVAGKAIQFYNSVVAQKDVVCREENRYRTATAK